MTYKKFCITVCMFLHACLIQSSAPQLPVSPSRRQQPLPPQWPLGVPRPASPPSPARPLSPSNQPPQWPVNIPRPVNPPSAPLVNTQPPTSPIRPLSPRQQPPSPPQFLLDAQRQNGPGGRSRPIQPTPAIPSTPSTPLPGGMKKHIPMAPTFVQKGSVEKTAAEYMTFLEEFDNLYKQAEKKKSEKLYKETIDILQQAIRIIRLLEMRLAQEEIHSEVLMAIQESLAQLRNQGAIEPGAYYDMATALSNRRRTIVKDLSSLMEDQVNFLAKKQITSADFDQLQELPKIALQLTEDRNKLAQILQKLKTEKPDVYTQLPADVLLNANKVLVRITPTPGGKI